MQQCPVDHLLHVTWITDEYDWNVATSNRSGLLPAITALSEVRHGRPTLSDEPERLHGGSVCLRVVSENARDDIGLLGDRREQCDREDRTTLTAVHLP